MARIDNLNNFLTDICYAVRTKTGKSDLITPANLDTEIINIPVQTDDDTLWFVRNGIEQENNTKGSLLTWKAGDREPGLKTQGDGYIALCAKVWSAYDWTFNVQIDYTKYAKLYIEWDYLNYDSSNSRQYWHLIACFRGANVSHDLKTTTVQERKVDVIELDSSIGTDQLTLDIANTGETADYANYPIRVYNIWLEKRELGLQDKVIEITENGTTTVVADEDYDGLNSVAINVNIEQNTETPKVDLNIFVQDTEPETKDGLWLKTDSKYDYIVVEPYIEPTTVIYTEQEPCPVKLVQGSSAQLGDYIYYFGGWGTSDNKTESYKYHIPTNTYTKLPNVPGPVEWGTEGVVIGTNIYFGGTHANTYFYKFDTLTDTYTQLAQSPVQLYGATMVVTPDQRYIYTFGGIYDYNYKPYYRCRYDVANNTWTYTRDNPIQLGGAAAFVHGDAAYFLCARLFTSWTNVAVAPKTYRFNFVTETWTVLGECPQDCHCWCGNVVGDDIYFLSGANSNSPEDGAGRFYRYNVPTDTYTRLDDAPISSYGSRIIAWLGDNQFLLLGCNGDEKRNLIAKIPVPEHDVYNKNTIIVWENINNRNYQSPQVRLYNFGSSISGFDSINNFYVRDVTYQTASGEDIDTYKAYYGDGTQWLKIEN